ncbi:MAG: membrane-bound O-acyltransferase family protein/MBOAT family protein [Treponematales bacterium]
MNFNSWQYLLFFPVVFALNYALTARPARHGVRLSQCFLLAASLFFYGCWNPAYLGLILFSVAVTWASGLLMEGKPKARKRLVLVCSLVLNLGILFFFKYYGLFAGTLAQFASVRLPSFNVLLPVGISFYTFQALGYSIDVYRGTVKAERDFPTYALFVTFFPQLVAGPIERSATLLPQFKTVHPFDYGRVTSGLKLAAWGMFKKVVIADRLAVYVNAVFAAPAEFPATALVLTVFFFAFQIYCDFSGYSDIARGCARALGFDLMTNFRAPYFAHSITDFWRRWHISLTAWFRDYVYIPLGGNRRGLSRQCLNIMAVFALSGLWHGAAWHFAAWGMAHGALQITERLWERKWKIENEKWIKISNGEIHFPLSTFHRLFTFIVVCLVWTLFRANSLSDAGLIFGKFAALPGELVGYLARLPQTGAVGAVRDMFQLGADVACPIAGFGLTACALSFLLIAALVASEVITRRTDGTALLAKMPLAARWAGYYVLVCAVILNWQTETSDFIYFTF